MATTTITNLPTVTSLTGTEPLLGVQNGNSVQITTGQIAKLSGTSSGYLISSVTQLANNPVTGTPSSSSYLRGDGTWATVSGSGTVTSITAGTGLSGGTITTTGTIDIASTGVSATSYGSSTAIPTFTVNAQGQLTTASTAEVIAPAGTLSGTTLNSSVVSSSLTSVGTIGTGVWNGTAIGPTYGGTGQTSYATGDLLYASATNTLSKLTAGTNGYVLTLASGVPTWAASGGGGSGTVNSGTAGQLTYYASTGTTVSGNANATISSGALTLGVATSVAGSLGLSGSTSGKVTLQTAAAAGTWSLILPTTAGTNGYVLSTDGTGVTSWIATSGGGGTVTSVGLGFSAGAGNILSNTGTASPITGSGTYTLAVSGTSGGIPYFSSASAWSSSAALTANALMIGGGAGAAPATTSTGTGVLTALGNSVNTTNGLATGSVTTLSSLVSVGTISTGVWNGTAIGATYGGTGQTVYVIGDLLYASSTTALSKLADVATGSVLVSGGVGAAPAYSSTPSVSTITTTASRTATSTTGAFAYGTNSFSDTGVLSSLQASANSYFQSTIQNTSAGATASTEFIVYNDQGTASNNYATVGINSSGYTGTGSINGAGYGFFLTASTDLVLGTIGANAMHFVTNSSATDAMTISSAGVVSLGTALAATSGGTAQSTYTTGDILYASATNTLSKLAIGSTNQVLTVVSGAPAWAAGSTVNSGTANQLTYYASTGAAVSGNANATISSGALTLGVSATTAGSLILSGSTSGAVTLNTAAAAGSWTMTLPTTAGTNNYVLATNGSGVTSWVAQTGGGSGTVASSTIGQVPVYTGATTVTGSTNLTLSSGALTVGVAGTQAGTLLLSGGTSGTTTLAVAAAASGTLTLPAGTGTVIATVTNMAANPVTGTPSSSNFLRGDGTWATPAGSGTITSSTIGQIPVYTAATTIGGNANLTYATGALTLGVATSQAGTLVLSGGTSGTTTLAVAAAASGTVTLPAATTTLAGLGVTQTFTATNTFSQVNYTNNAVTVTSNAGTVPITYRLNTFTNSSAATMTITMATARAVDGQMSIVRIYDFSSAAQTISWVGTENSTISVPLTSNGSTTLPRIVGFMYNSATTLWRCIASA